MITQLLKWFIQLFKTDYQTRLEQYIEVRCPTSVGDVEYLEREYSRYQNRGLL